MTSLVIGSEFSLKDSFHVFMMDFDSIENERIIIEEARRLHHKWNIDLFIYQSSKDGYHVNSFDIVSSRMVQTVQADVRIDNDYPLINDRLFDKFLTLRCWFKNRKPIPHFIGRFVAPNRFMKSQRHYMLYHAVAGLSEPPEWYQNQWYEMPNGNLLASYVSRHRLI